VGELDRKHGVDTAQLQAVHFAARERRRSLAGIPKLHRTHRFVGASAMAVPSIDPSVVFAGMELAPMTFKTAIRITGGSPAGCIFEFSSTPRGVALAVLDRFIAVVGGGLTTEQALAVFDNGMTLPTGLELEMVAAIDPGTGRSRLWANGQEIARATASGGDFGVGWGAAGLGSFAAAANGTIHNAVATSAGAPTDFDVIEPLSVYARQMPRQFV